MSSIEIATNMLITLLQDLGIYIVGVKAWIAIYVGIKISKPEKEYNLKRNFNWYTIVL